MKLLKLYEWIIGTQNEFTREFKDNELLFNQARSFWNSLDGSIGIVLIGMLFIAIVVCAYYYTAYNNMPGRHYKLTHWGGFMVVAFLSTFVISLVLEYVIWEPKLKGAFALEAKIAFANAIYSSIAYFIASVFWCNWGSTNACRFLKFIK